MSNAGLLGGGGGGGGSVSIGDTIGGGAANRVLYLNSTPVLAQNSIFKFRDTSGLECLSIGAFGPISYARAVLSWDATDSIASGFQPAGATSPGAVVNTGDGAGNWPPATTIYYKIYSYITIGTQRLYTNSPVVVSLLYPATDSGTISWTASVDTITGYRVWISLDSGSTYTQARDSSTTSIIDSNEEPWEADDIESGDPLFPSFVSYYGYYPGSGGANVFSVYGNSGYFSNAVGIGTDTPTVKLEILEPTLAQTAVKIIRDGSTSLNPMAFQVQNVAESAAAGATIESGGPNDFAALRMAGTRVSTNDYLGVFEFQNLGASGDRRVGMIVGLAGTGSVNGSMQFLTRNGSGFQTCITLTEDGYVGIGGVTPTARFHLPAGAAAANKAPLRFTSGTDLTTAVAGAMEYNGTRLAFSPSTTRKRVALTNDVAPSNGQIPIGNGTDFTTASLTAGSNITITPGAGTITIAASGGSGASWTETEIDFGSTPQWSKTFTVTDAGVSGTSKIILCPSGNVATDRVGNDMEWDNLILSALPGTGSFTVSAMAFPGPIVGKRKIFYTVA